MSLYHSFSGEQAREYLLKRFDDNTDAQRLVERISDFFGAVLVVKTGEDNVAPTPQLFVEPYESRLKTVVVEDNSEELAILVIQLLQLNLYVSGKLYDFGPSIVTYNYSYLKLKVSEEIFLRFLSSFSKNCRQCLDYALIMPDYLALGFPRESLRELSISAFHEVTEWDEIRKIEPSIDVLEQCREYLHSLVCIEIAGFEPFDEPLLEIVYRSHKNYLGSYIVAERLVSWYKRDHWRSLDSYAYAIRDFLALWRLPTCDEYMGLKPNNQSPRFTFRGIEPFKDKFVADFSINEPALDSGKYVYHYTTAETALNHILYSGTLRFGPLSNVNDPREAKHFSFSLWKGEEGISDDEVKRVWNIMTEGASKYLKQHIKILCVTRDTDISNMKLVDPIFGSKYRGYGHPRMWSQYGDNHKGICLVFDKQILDQKILSQLGKHNRILRGDVEYQDLHLDLREQEALELDYAELKERGLEQVMAEKVERFSDIYFLRKHLDWAQEQEYRWLISSKHVDPEYVRFGTALACIILGADMDDENTQRVLDFSNRSGIPIYWIGWLNGLPMMHTIEGSHAGPSLNSEAHKEKYDRAMDRLRGRKVTELEHPKWVEPYEPE